jgi:stage IV sporulation protein FB
VRSLLSLFIYALLFYFIFERNVAYIAAILIVLLIHELGHFAFMRLFHYSNVRIFIIPLMGAFTSGKKQKASQRQLTIIILGGPVPGILIGCLLLYLNRDLQHETLRMLANAFLVINLLNCLPFYPLDGGRLLETLFFRENHMIRLAFGIISIMALLILFAFFFSPVLLIIPALIALELYNEHKHQKIRDYLKQEGINYRTDYEALPDRDFWLIRDCLILSFPKKYAAIPPGKYEYTPLEPVVINQVNAVLQVDLKPDLGVAGRLIVLLFYAAIFIGPLVFIYAMRQPG